MNTLRILALSMLFFSASAMASSDDGTGGVPTNGASVFCKLFGFCPVSLDDNGDGSGGDDGTDGNGDGSGGDNGTDGNGDGSGGDDEG